MLGKSGTLYLAHMSMEDMEPTVGSKFPFNRNVFFGATMAEAMDKGRVACGNDEAECEKYLGLMQVEFERGKEANGDSPNTFYIRNITKRYNWGGTKELELRLPEAAQGASNSLHRSLSELADAAKPDDASSTSTSASKPGIAALITHSPTPWMVTTQRSLNADPKHTANLSR